MSSFKIYNPDTIIPVIKNNTNQQLITGPISGPPGPTGPVGPTGAGGSINVLQDNYPQSTTVFPGGSATIYLGPPFIYGSFSSFSVSGIIISSGTTGTYNYEVNIIDTNSPPLNQLFVANTIGENIKSSFCCTFSAPGPQLTPIQYGIRITNKASSPGTLGVLNTGFDILYS